MFGQAPQEEFSLRNMYLKGMFVREAISEGVLWLGQPRERQR